MTGAVASASENAASIKSLVANLLMHRSCSRCEDSVDKASAGRLFQGGRERAIFRAVGAGKLGDPVQMILCLVAVALLDLPKAVILPGPHMARVGLQRALVPYLAELVVAELAVGIADQIGDVGAVVMAQRLQLFDRHGVIAAVIDRSVGRAIAGEEFRVVNARTLVVLLLVL